MTARRLNGSVMVMINPPWQMEKHLQALQPWLAAVLAVDNHAHERLHWLAGE